MRFIQPKIFDSSQVQAAVSTRKGGVSQGDFSSLNLGKSTSDNQEHVKENRRLFFSDLGIDEHQTAVSYQVHGCEILTAEQPCRENGYDALITSKSGLFLVVSVADCVPVLVHNPIKNVVAAIHAGWKGTVSQIVFKTIEKMKNDFSCDPAHNKLFIGPGIGYDHFEVGDEVARHFSHDLKRPISGTSKFLVDLKSTNKKQAINAGTIEKNIETSEFCTFCEETLFFSHRRDKGNTGRMIAVIGMR